MLGRSQLGRGCLPGFSLSFSRGVLPAPGRVRAKKVPVLPLPPPISRVQLPGSGATLLQYSLLFSLFSRKGAFSSQQQGFSSVRRAGHGLSLTADAATRVFPAVCRPGSPHRSVILWRVPRAPPAGAAGSGGTEHRFEARRRTRPGLLRPGSPGRGLPAPGQARGASAGSGPRRRRPVRVRGDLNSRFRENTDGHARASDLTIDLPHRLAGRARAPSGYTRIPLRQHHGSHHGRPCRQFTDAGLTQRPRRGVSAPGGALTPSLRLTERTGP